MRSWSCRCVPGHRCSLRSASFWARSFTGFCTGRTGVNFARLMLAPAWPMPRRGVPAPASARNAMSAASRWSSRGIADARDGSAAAATHSVPLCTGYWYALASPMTSASRMHAPSRSSHSPSPPPPRCACAPGGPQTACSWPRASLCRASSLGSRVSASPATSRSKASRLGGPCLSRGRVLRLDGW